MRVLVLPIWKAREAPEGSMVVNTTSSSSSDVFRQLSPFYLGPCNLYGDYVAKVMENGWQFSKVYVEHLDGKKVSKRYWRWAKAGWKDSQAHRYPMGRGIKPKFSLWEGERLPYVEARKRIYVPLYAQAVIRTQAYSYLVEIHKHKTLVLLDYDAYDHEAAGMTLKDVLKHPTKKMGHAFVLVMLLKHSPALLECGLTRDLGDEHE